MGGNGARSGCVHYITRLQYDASENKIQNMSSGKKLGENLRNWRLKKKMSQGDLATALSVDRANRGSEWRKWDLHVHTQL